MLTNAAELRPYLGRLSMHSVLGEPERQAILSLPFKRVGLQPNKDFVRVGEQVPHSCFIVEGLVARFGRDWEGNRQLTALHIPGDMPDLHSAIRPSGIGGLTTLSATTILQIPHAPLLQVAAEYPILNEALWRDCLMDAAVLADWLMNVGRRHARARIAHLFCEMSVRYARGRGHLDRFPFSVTQEQVADIVALTPVHVNRSLRALREEGLVVLRAGAIVISDWERLASVGEFDPAYLVGDMPVLQ